MASTAGGFLFGFGLCLLLASLGAHAILGQYYGQIIEWRGEVEQIYELTHSPAYEASMRALEKLSPHANRLADLMRDYGWIIGIGWLSEYIRQIGSAASYMKRVYEASEAAHRALRAIEVAPQLLEYGIAAGLALIVVGVALILRARRRLASG